MIQRGLLRLQVNGRHTKKMADLFNQIDTYKIQQSATLPAHAPAQNRPARRRHHPAQLRHCRCCAAEWSVRAQHARQVPLLKVWLRQRGTLLPRPALPFLRPESFFGDGKGKRKKDRMCSSFGSSSSTLTSSPFFSFPSSCFELERRLGGMNRPSSASAVRRTYTSCCWLFFILRCECIMFWVPPPPPFSRNGRRCWTRARHASQRSAPAHVCCSARFGCVLSR